MSPSKSGTLLLCNLLTNGSLTTQNDLISVNGNGSANNIIFIFSHRKLLLFGHCTWISMMSFETYHGFYAVSSNLRNLNIQLKFNVNMKICLIRDWFHQSWNQIFGKIINEMAQHDGTTKSYKNAKFLLWIGVNLEI